MPHVPGLRSPYDRIGRIFYFGRMLDKIRLHAAGRLPADYACNLGEARPTLLDGRCCRFLGIAYEDLRKRTLEGGDNEEILAWGHARGQPRSDEECAVWNAFMAKLGWRDSRAAALRERIRECGLEGRAIETFFDMIEADEGRDPERGREAAAL